MIKGQRQIEVWDVWQHKDVVWSTLKDFTLFELFQLLHVSSALRRLWRVDSCLPKRAKLEVKAAELKLAREWRKALGWKIKIYKAYGVVYDLEHKNPLNFCATQGNFRRKRNEQDDRIIRRMRLEDEEEARSERSRRRKDDKRETKRIKL